MHTLRPYVKDCLSSSVGLPKRYSSLLGTVRAVRQGDGPVDLSELAGYKQLMATERRATSAGVEQLVRDLDAGVYDDRLPPQSEAVGTPVLQKFEDVQPFDVRAWAARKGVKLPDRS